MKRTAITLVSLVALFIPSIGMYCSAQPPVPTAWRVVLIRSQVSPCKDKASAHANYAAKVQAISLDPESSVYLEQWNGKRWVKVSKVERGPAL
jgi:hypothetical protein